MKLNYLALLVYCGCLVCGYELVKVLEGKFPSLMMAAARAMLAAVTILLFCLAARQPILPALRRSVQLALVGILGFGMLWAMVSFGERQVDPEMAMLLVCVVPIATLVITALPPHPQRIWWPAWVGTAIATLGLVVVIGPDRLFDEPSALHAILMIGFGFASFALSGVLAERMTKGLPPTVVAGVTMLYAALLLWVLVFVLEPPTMKNHSTDTWLNLLGLGVVGSALPAILVFILVQRAGAGFMSLYGYLLPVLGIFIGWLAFGEDPRSTFLIGMPITFAGVAIVQWARRHDFSAGDPSD